MHTLRFAVVGYGHIGKRHAAILQAFEGIELAAVCDTRASYREEVASTLRVPFFTSLEALLRAPLHLDAVCVCTPNGLHASQAERALTQGLHVVIEKPMGLSKAACERVLFTSLRVHRHVFCVMQNRYSPPIRWLKSLVDEGLLGNIYMVNIDCFWNRNEAYYRGSPWKGTLDQDGGPLFTQFSHFVDIMYWLFGDITALQGQFGTFRQRALTQFEDTGSLQFEFLQGGMGTFTYSTATWDQNFESSITILAERGTVKIGGQYMDTLVYCHLDGYEAPTLSPSSPPNDYGPYQGSAANHHFVFENVVASLKGQSNITTNALEGLKVVEIIERMYALRSLQPQGVP